MNATSNQLSHRFAVQQRAPLSLKLLHRTKNIWQKNNHLQPDSLSALTLWQAIEK
jgi:hypothetical protein